MNQDDMRSDHKQDKFNIVMYIQEHIALHLFITSCVNCINCENLAF